jgi:hypothetical protein
MFNISGHTANANKMTLRFHLTSVRMAIIKNKVTSSAGVEAGEKEPIYTVLGNSN